MSEQFSLPATFSFLIFSWLLGPAFQLMQLVASSSFIHVLIQSLRCLSLPITLFQCQWLC
jgi:hypothetical protein